MIRHTRPLAIVGGLLAVLFGTSTVAAHETWLQPLAFYVDAPGPQLVRMTSGMGEHYPMSDSAIEPDRIVSSGAWVGLAKYKLIRPVQTEHELELTWLPARFGVTAIYVSLAPKTLILPDSLINVYMDEIGASATLRRQWADIPSPKQWRESYAKHAKTYVRIGSENQPWAKVGRDSVMPWRPQVGLPLEIVPESDPTQLHVGDSLWVHVIYKYIRQQNFTLAVFGDSTGKPTYVNTGRTARVAIPLTFAGDVLLSGVNLRKVREPGLDWRSDFTTMTFEVRPR